MDTVPVGEAQAAIASVATYAASGVLVAGSFVDYLDNHALAFGVVFGGITCFTNFYFRRMERRDKLRGRLKRIQEED